MKLNLTLLGFIRKELVQVLRDPRMRVTLFVTPMVQMFIFGWGISNDVKNVRLGAYYKPNDRVARHIYERCQSSGWFRPADAFDPDPVNLVKSDKAEAAIIAPPEGLTEAIQHRNGRLQLLVNATNVIRAQQVEAYVQTNLLRVLRDDHLIPDADPPLTFEMRILYNPAMETAVFLVPSIVCMILCMVTIMLTSMTLAREKEIGTFEMLISAPVKSWEILLGKTIPYVIFGALDLPIILSVAVFVFKVPFKGNIFVLALSSLAFICSTVSLGTLISTYARSQQQAMMASFLFLFPAILLSGTLYPVENLPTAIRYISYGNPLRYFVTLIRNIMLKGGDFHLVAANVGALIGLTVIFTTLCFARFKRTL